jgi:hypothetical protein
MWADVASEDQIKASTIITLGIGSYFTRGIHRQDANNDTSYLCVQ